MFTANLIVHFCMESADEYMPAWVTAYMLCQVYQTLQDNNAFGK